MSKPEHDRRKATDAEVKGRALGRRLRYVIVDDPVRLDTAAVYYGDQFLGRFARAPVVEYLDLIGLGHTTWHDSDVVDSLLSPPEVAP